MSYKHCTNNMVNYCKVIHSIYVSKTVDINDTFETTFWVLGIIGWRIVGIGDWSQQRHCRQSNNMDKV